MIALEWNGTLYCTHPYHVLRNNNNPERVSKYIFRKKNCGNQSNGICRWLISYQRNPIKQTKEQKKKQFNEDAKSKNKLKNMCENKDKHIRNLTDEVIDLSKKLEYYKDRYNTLHRKLISVGKTIQS